MSDISSPTEPRKPWWQPGPFDYSSVELFIMRAAFTVLLFASIKWETAPFKTQRDPTGLAHFFDLTWLAEHPPGVAWQMLTLCGLIFYVVGYLPALGLAPVLSFAVLIGTLVTSKAMHHSWQLVTLIGLAQLIIYAWPRSERGHRMGLWALLAVLAALALLESKGIVVTKEGVKGLFSWLGHFIQIVARYGILGWLACAGLGRLHRSLSCGPDLAQTVRRPSLAVHRLAIHASTVVIAASYVVCGVVKLVNSDFKWIAKVPMLSVQLLKSNWSHYYDSVPQAIMPSRLMPPDSPEWLDQVVQAIVDYPNLARLVFGSGLLIELTAFIILINRRWAFWGGLLIVAFHLSISQVMQLDFNYHIAAVIIFLVNVPGMLLALKTRSGRTG